ncbi:MAG TPA: ribosome silencing factor [Fimbriimonas sp.]|nr:ribosome silencing factor [Fimbriimonas sp.]
MTSKEKSDAIVDAADDMKAEQVEVLDVRAKTSVADYFIVCTGTSDRHVDSIADKVAEKMAALKSKPLRVEGDKSGWVLQDYGDVIFHVMREEQRQFYDLETLWKGIRPDPSLE